MFQYFYLIRPSSGNKMIRCYKNYCYEFEKAVKNRNSQEYSRIDKQTTKELLMKQNKFFRCFESMVVFLMAFGVYTIEVSSRHWLDLDHKFMKSYPPGRNWPSVYLYVRTYTSCIEEEKYMVNDVTYKVDLANKASLT